VRLKEMTSYSRPVSSRSQTIRWERDFSSLSHVLLLCQFHDACHVEVRGIENQVGMVITR